MCIFSDSDILDHQEGEAPLIAPFVEANLTPNGYDLSIAEVVIPDDAEAAPVRSGAAVIPPGTRFAVATKEVVTLPGNASAQLWIRSSYARKGVLAAFGKVEAGFSGTLTIGAFNAAASPLTLPIGERFCQIAFERLHSAPRALYAERSGNYQNQRGVTLQPRGGDSR